MNKPTKPNITIPESFAANGVKADFDNNKILNGFDRIQPDVLAGDNLNKFIDDTYKGLNYGIKGVDYLEERWKSQLTNCILEAPNGLASYSGSTITVKSGIKVLIPFGKNEDGTLKNIEYTTDERVYTETTSRSENAVITIAIDNNGHINAYVNYFSQEENPNTPYTCWYKPSENNFYTSDGESNFSLARIVPILFYKSSNLQIINVIPYNTVDLLKRSNKSEISSWGMPSNKYIDLTLGASGTFYTAPANGYFTIDKKSSSANQYVQFINVSVQLATNIQAPGTFDIRAFIPVKKGQQLKINYNAGGEVVWFRFIYAEGEV